MLAQLTNIIEEQARRRFQQQQQQLQQLHRGQPFSEEFSGPEFTYRLPDYVPSTHPNEKTPFAIGPSDPKYYERIDDDRTPIEADLSSSSIYQNILKNNDESPVRLSSDGILSYKLKAPMDINPKITPFDENTADHSYELSKSKDVMTLENFKKLKELRNKNAHEDLVHLYQNDVLKKHMEIDTAMGMYVIALIAGVSAAVSVGLLAIGIGWYTYVRTILNH